jgi:TP901 family phage tail tape measure protein
MATLFTVGIEVQASQAQQAILRLERAFNQMSASASGAQQAGRDVGRELNESTRQINKYADEMEKAARSQMDFERGALAVSAAMGALAFKAKQYINSVTQVGQAVQGAVAANSTLAKDAKGLDQAFRQLTKELNYSTNSMELNKAAYDVLSAGVSDTADVLNVMKAGVAGAKGGFSDLGTVTDAVTTIMNAYGKSASEAQKIVDMMITTQNDGKIVAAQYGQQIGVVAAGAANAGVKLEELNAAVSVATVAGVQISSTFTGLRQAISSIVSPSEQAKKLAKELGIEFSQNALKSKGFAGVLKDVAAATKGNAEQITKLFGSVEAKATIDPILNNLQKYEQFLNNQTKAAGSAADATAKVTKGLGAAQAALANIATEASRKVFETIEPGVTLLTNATTGLAKVFVDLPEPIQKVVIGIGLVTAGVAAATAATIAFNAVGLTASAIMGGLATAVGILTAPITLVVIGIGAAALAFKEFYDSSENLRKVLARFGDAATKIFNVFARAVARVTGTFGDYESGTTSALKGTGDAIARFLEGAVSGFENFAKFIESRAAAINATIKSIGDGFNAVADAALYIFDLKTSGKEQADINLRQRQAQRRIAEEQIPPYLRNRAQQAAVAKASATSAATASAVTYPGMDEEERKKLEQEALRQEKELADKRKQEFEERQRLEREAFQDRKQYEETTLNQRTNYEMRIFDLQTRHQQILKDQRLETESEIARAVIRSQQEIESLQRQIERRRLERQLQMQQRAMQVMGLSQQMAFEQGQAGQAAKFNQGQFVGGGGGAAMASLSGILAYTGNTGIGSGPHLDLRGFTGADRKNRIGPQRLKEISQMIQAGNKPLSAWGITSGYGPRRAPVAGASTFHPGFDYGTPAGTPIRFTGQATNVKQRPNQGGAGHVLEITLPTGEIVQLLHLQKFGQALGQAAKQGGAMPSGGANSRGNAIAQAAKILGVNPLDLATIIEFESDGIPNRRGGAGGNYQGLIQFGPAERKKYGYNPGMSFEDQVLGPVVRYFKDRFKGVGMSTQGASLEDLYTTVLAGNPKANRGARDAFGTSARSGVQKMLKPGADRDVALKKYFGGNAPGGGGAGGGMEPYGLANVPNVTVTQLDLQAKLNELHTEQSINLREQAIEQAELNKLIQEQANIAPQMMRDNLRQLKEQTRQIEVESNLLRLQGEERKDYLAQLEYEKLYKNEILALEQAIRDTSDPVQKLALQKALVEAVKQEGEVRAAIAVNQAAQDQLESQRKQVEWAESQIQSLKSLTFSMSVMNQEQEMAVRMADNMGNAFADAFTRFATGTGTAQEAFAGFMSGMVSVFAQEVQRMVAVAVANNLFPGLLNLFGGGGAPSLFGGGFSGGGGFSIGGITGGVASGVALPGFSVPALADGGVVRKPTMALIGERGPEAVVPLDQMGGGVNSVVNVTVNNDGSVKTDSNQGNELGRAIQRAVVDEIARQKRSGGLLASVK